MLPKQGGAKRYLADPKGTAFFEPRKRRENATSEEVKNHAIQFFKNVSTKIRGESKKGRYRMDISVKDAHTKWLMLAKLGKSNGGLGQDNKFQRSLTWFRKLRPKEVLVPLPRGNIPTSSRRHQSSQKVSGKGSNRSKNLHVQEDEKEDDRGGILSPAVIAATPMSPISAGRVPEQGLVDPLLPPPKWL